MGASASTLHPLSAELDRLDLPLPEPAPSAAASAALTPNPGPANQPSLSKHPMPSALIAKDEPLLAAALAIGQEKNV